MRQRIPTAHLPVFVSQRVPRPNVSSCSPGDSSESGADSRPGEPGIFEYSTRVRSVASICAGETPGLASYGLRVPRSEVGSWYVESHKLPAPPYGFATKSRMASRKTQKLAEVFLSGSQCSAMARAVSIFRSPPAKYPARCTMRSNACQVPPLMASGSRYCLRRTAPTGTLGYADVTARQSPKYHASSSSIASRVTTE